MIDRVKDAALAQCKEADTILRDMREHTDNQVLYLAVMAALQRVNAEQAFWQDA